MYYDFVKPDGRVDYMVLKDITQNTRFKAEVLQNLDLYEYYSIKDGETPELISEKFYGTPFYHWIIMLVNERYDYINDFPLTLDVLEKIIEEKYGTPGKYDTHHYEYNGYVVDSDFAADFQVAVDEISNYDYELALNEKKRRLKIITPALLETVLDDFRRLI